jgi:hypothetical protein
MLKAHPTRAWLAMVLAVGGLSPAAQGQQSAYPTAKDMTESATTSEAGELPPRYSMPEAQWPNGMSPNDPGHGMARGYLPGQGCGGCGCNGGGCEVGPNYSYGPCDGYGNNCPCPCPCPPNHWEFGGGGYFLSARWKTNPAFQTTETVGGVVFTTQTDFDYDLQFAPLVWVGWHADCGLGIEARAWWYDDDDHLDLVNPGGGVLVNSAAPLGLDVLSTAAGDALTFDSSLKIQVQDLMLTYAMQMGCGWIEFGAGARHARIEQEYHARVVSAGGVVSGVDSTNSFEGVGPSFALQGRLSLTQRLSLVTAFRYSLIIGSAEQDASLILGNVLSAQRRQANEDFRPVSEVEFGADYALGCGCWQWYVQAAFVAQLWQGAGNSADNDPLILRGDPPSDKNADLLLYGFRAETGFRF